MYRWVRPARAAAARAEARLTARLPALGVIMPTIVAITTGTVRDCALGAILIVCATLQEKGGIVRASRNRVFSYTA